MGRVKFAHFKMYLTLTNKMLRHKLKTHYFGNQDCDDFHSDLKASEGCTEHHAILE